jgi:hypothetical protein
MLHCILTKLEQLLPHQLLLQLKFYPCALSALLKLVLENLTHAIRKKEEKICQKIVRNVSSKSRSTVTSNTLKTIADEQCVSTRGGTVKLQTGSKAIPVKIGTVKVKPKEPTFSHENLKRLQAANNLSDKSLL